MFINPTRTQLLQLKEKANSVVNSIGILKARRQALIKEFLSITMPFLRTREEVRKTYGNALDELSLSTGREGRRVIDSLSMSTEREFCVEVTEKSVWGLKYKDIIYKETPVRPPDERGYDYRPTTPHVEEGIYLFERVLDYMLEIAAYESKLKRLSDEIMKTTRKIRVLEERVQPGLKGQIKTIRQYLSEREREAHYRLKKFKEMRLTGD